MSKITNEISIIIPLFNEEESIESLYNKVSMAIQMTGYKYEIIFVDDGSTDNSIEMLKKIRQEDDRIKIIKFRRNFGKAAALMAGFNLASGDIMITMDADLQDEPEEIPNFINKINEGYDLVSGWKVKRHDPISKTWPSKLFNKTISIVSGLKLHDFNCGFKAYKKVVAKNISIYGELHRYIPALAHAKGFKVTEIGVKHNPREFGKSKYGIERITRGFFDCITVLFLTRYKKRPLHFFGKFGLISGISGFGICSYLTVLKLLGQKIGDRPLLILGVLLILLGAQFISTGLIGELITQVNPKNDSIFIEEII